MPCETCHDSFWVVERIDGVDRVRRCDCWRATIAEQQLAHARIPRRYAHCELSNFEYSVDSLREAHRRARGFVEAFPAVDKGLLLRGRHGVGKTHLAVAMLKDVIRTKGARGYFYETRELLKLVRDTYAGGDATEMDVLRPVLDADLLVLDDLGAEKTSEWVQETLGLVVNTRYSERRPTIFTTNLEDSADSTSPISMYLAARRAHPVAPLRDVPLGRDGWPRCSRGRAAPTRRRPTSPAISSLPAPTSGRAASPTRRAGWRAPGCAPAAPPT